MSEAAGAGSAGGSSDVTPATGSADTAAQSQGMQDGQSREGQERTPAEIAADEMEEIALGSVKGKVPKSIAKAIKDFERGSQAKMREAAEYRKHVADRDKMLDLFESDPDKFAEMYSKSRGKKVDLDDMAEARLAHKYKLMTMTPEQRDHYETKQRLQQIEANELQSKSGVISEIQELLGPDAPKGLEQYPKEQLQHYLQQQKATFDQTQQSLNQEIVDAWKESGLPKHPYFGAQMSFRMLSHQKRTGQPLQASEAASKVKADFMSAVRDVVSQMDPQGIQELLGKDTLTKVRQHDIDRVTGKMASSVGQPNRPGGMSASEKPKQPMNEYEYRNYIRNMKV